MDFSLFLIDLQETHPLEIRPMIPPYLEDMDIEEKFLKSYMQLQRSIQLKNRILSLVNAYFIGKILTEIESTSERFRMKRRLTKHYLTMTEYTFNLFEPNPSQILRTKYLNVQDIRKMKRQEILVLRSYLNKDFAGAQNLGEESC
ncbi:hypothetical protein RclHR1_37430002 [Rhizophagus clarus]|uniref:Uncharacterized protein n=1 Tax=Rhizophagus clarus TaxID=94130 RepID=A0A2Z6RD88_9GLOM|nr:hypothetical protein RclHR1_37430002 [Rhizophagus clarus]GES73392.1 hypothetical protein GLOIN_2v1884596 [Rhizophagus clarus]